MNFKALEKLQIILKTTALLFIFLLSQQVKAHKMEQGYIFLTIGDDYISGRIEMTIDDLNRALSLNLPADGTVDASMLLPHSELIKNYYRDRVKIKLQNGLDLKQLEVKTIHNFAQYVVLSFSFEQLKELPSALDIEYGVLFDVYPEHRGFLIIENDWRSGTFDQEANIALVFTPDENTRQLDLTQSSVMQGYVEMLKLGIHHIWEGIDHILFLIALLLPSVMIRSDKSWQASKTFYPPFIHVVKIVTVFTIAHTITLTLATLDVVSLPSRLVESIIAISIAIAAINILYPVFNEKIWLVIFAFGLFHGFGFASVLAEYQIPDSYLTLSLLAFNLGVEVGQVAIVCVVFPLLFILRSSTFYSKAILNGGAVGLIVVSLYWFIERGFMIDLSAMLS